VPKVWAVTGEIGGFDTPGGTWVYEVVKVGTTSTGLHYAIIYYAAPNGDTRFSTLYTS
jgi:hypothetical protein